MNHVYCYEIVLTSGALGSGYLTVDKNYFPENTWGNAKDKIKGALFTLRIDGAGFRSHLD